MITDSSWAVPWDLLDTKRRPFFFFFFFRSPENGSISHLFAVYWKITSWNCQLAAMRRSQEMGKQKERYCDITKGRFTELCHLACTLSEICSEYKNMLYENIQEMLLSHNYLYLCPSPMRRTLHFFFCESGHWRGDCSFTLRLIPYARREHAWLAALHCTHRGNPKFQS